MGPLSDRFGRRPVLIDGMALYCIASVLAIMASSFETLRRQVVAEKTQ
jgi:DHA1 family bicyclomycin/chloramphenicol resistance-like MFS transporter